MKLYGMEMIIFLIIKISFIGLIDLDPVRIYIQITKK